MDLIRGMKSIHSEGMVKVFLLAILLFGVAIKTRFLFQESLWPDEALYLYIARNLSTDLTNLTDITGGVFYQSPPILMYLLSFVQKIQYFNFDQMARIVLVAMGAGTVLITYFIGRKLYHPLVGIVAALFLAACPLSNWNGVRILTDIPVVFFIYLSICMLVYERKLAFYIFGICAVLTKYSAFPVLFLPVFMRLKPKSWALAYLIGFGTLFIFAISKNIFPKPDGWVGYFYNFINLPNTVHMVKEVEYFLGYFVIVFVLLGVFFTVREHKYSAIFHWVCIFGICRIFLPWVLFRVSRYSLPLYPGIYILASYGIYRIAQNVMTIWPVYSIWVKVFFGVIIGNILINHSIKSLELLDRTSTAFTGFDQACEFIMKQPGPYSVATASPNQMKYFAPGFDVYDIAINVSPEKLRTFFNKERINFLSIDLWSPHLPSWCKSFDYQKNGFNLIYQQNNVYVFKVTLPEQNVIIKHF